MLILFIFMPMSCLRKSGFDRRLVAEEVFWQCQMLCHERKSHNSRREGLLNLRLVCERHSEVKTDVQTLHMFRRLRNCIRSSET